RLKSGNWRSVHWNKRDSRVQRRLKSIAPWLRAILGRIRKPRHGKWCANAFSAIQIASRQPDYKNNCSSRHKSTLPTTLARLLLRSQAVWKEKESSDVLSDM